MRLEPKPAAIGPQIHRTLRVLWQRYVRQPNEMVSTIPPPTPSHKTTPSGSGIGHLHERHRLADHEDVQREVQSPDDRRAESR